MKRVIYICLAFLAAACTPEEAVTVYATHVNISQENAAIVVGKTCTLTASPYPENVTTKGVVWSSLDEAIAKVSEDGVVTAVSPGITYIVATSADGRARSSCMVNVKLMDGYFISVLDETGAATDCLFRYPGASFAVAAESSDDYAHTYTWSTSNPAAVSLDKEIISFHYVKSADPEYLCYAESVLTVRSEDNESITVPASSNILSEFTLGGVPLKVGSEMSLNPDSSTQLVLWYWDGKEKQPVPPGAYSVTSSQSTVVGVQMSSDGYTLQSAGSGTARLRVSFQEGEGISLVDFRVVKTVHALFGAASSSTLSFTWTEGSSTEEDIARPYTISLYKDEACTQQVVSYDIPAGSSCWKDRQPRFVFSGLEPSTTYWFKVLDTTPGDTREGNLVSGTTAPFTVIEPGDEEAEAGDILLAEDFSELLWGADETDLAAGFDVGGDGSSSFSNREAASFVGTTGQYAQRQLTVQSTAKKNGRISRWAQGQYNRLYIGPGYVFLSTKSYATHLVTPVLNNIPEGKTATIRITLHAAGKVNGGKAALAVQHEKKFNEIGGGTQTNKNTLDLTSNVQTITFSGGLTQPGEYSVTLSNVAHGDRIAFGPTSESAAADSNMMLISDMTIELLTIN